MPAALSSSIWSKQDHRTLGTFKNYSKLEINQGKANRPRNPLERARESIFEGDAWGPPKNLFDEVVVRVSTAHTLRSVNVPQADFLAGNLGDELIIQTQRTEQAKIVEIHSNQRRGNR